MRAGAGPGSCPNAKKHARAGQMNSSRSLFMIIDRIRYHIGSIKNSLSADSWSLKPERRAALDLNRGGICGWDLRLSSPQAFWLNPPRGSVDP